MIIRIILAFLVFGVFNLQASAQTTYSIGSTKQGSLSYAVATTVAKLMNKKGLLARVQPKGGAANVAAIQKGSMNFNVNNAAESRFAHFGKELYEGRPHNNLMLATMVFPLRLTLAVPANSSVTRIPDIKGLKMGAKFTNNTVIQFVQRVLLANGGLKQSDMKNRPYANWIPAANDMARGKLDVAMIPPGTGASKKHHAMLKSRGGLRFLPIDTGVAAMKRTHALFPEAFSLTLKPSKAMPGIIGPTPVVAYPHFLTVSRHTPTDVVYKTVKAMHENKKQLVKGFRPFNLFDPMNMAPKSPVPYHPGAVKFYKEKGIL